MRAVKEQQQPEELQKLYLELAAEMANLYSDPHVRQKPH